MMIKMKKHLKKKIKMSQQRQRLPLQQDKILRIRRPIKESLCKDK